MAIIHVDDNNFENIYYNSLKKDKNVVKYIKVYTRISKLYAF